MARRRRHHFPGATYHVILRGNNGQSIFSSNADRCRMCFLLQEGVARFEHRILAFCFMTNHVHLAIQVGEVGLSAIIQNLAFRYTRYFNQKLNRIGHLFQGRFRSILVDNGRYLKKLIRYIHLNPIRASMVSRPEDYQWSSHRAYLALDELTWLTSDYALRNFGDNRSVAMNSFHDFVLAGIDVEEELDFETGRCEGILGDDDFVEIVKLKCVEKGWGSNKVELELNDLVQIVLNHYQIDETTLQAAGKERMPSYIRAVLALMVKETSEISLEQLANYLGRDASSLSRTVARLEMKARCCSKLADEIERLKNEMSKCQAPNSNLIQMS